MPAHSTGRASAPEPGLYRPRRTEQSLLHRLVREHLETFLDLARRDDAEFDPVPAFVERSFRKYLECGVLAHGFARVRCGRCGYDFLVAFSCRTRGLCPSCDTRRMVETAAALTDQVLPRVPIRQWVLSLPKRVRWYLRHRPETLSPVLGIYLRAVETAVRRASPEAPAGARFGAVAFVHHFGAALNGHTHFHCLITDGLFAATPTGEAVFYEAGAADVGRVQAQVRRRVLAWLARHGYLEAEAVDAMLAWRHSGGFSVDASVRLAAWDRQGLERLARYCARPSFSSARLDRLNAETLAYRLKKPLADGRTCLYLTPLELLARLAALIPPPRQHRTRYHGVLAPHARLRAAVVATAGPSEAMACQLRAAAARMELDDEAVPPAPEPPPSTRAARYAWAMLLVRIYEVLPLICPRCGGAMRIVAFVTEQASVRRVLEHLGEAARPSPLSPSRAPPWAEFAWGGGGEDTLDQRTQYSDEPW